MIIDFLLVALHTLGAVAAAAVLVGGFVFVIFAGEANARDRSVVSRRFDRLAALVSYLSWFGLLWWFGFSKLLFMLACGAAVALCVLYAVSYQTAASRLRRHAAASPPELEESRPLLEEPYQSLSCAVRCQVPGPCRIPDRGPLHAAVRVLLIAIAGLHEAYRGADDQLAAAGLLMRAERERCRNRVL